MEKLYEGKAKEVYLTEKADEYIIRYKDDATAGNGEKKATIALGVITKEEYDYLREETLKINELLKEFFLKINLKLVDFKIEFGKTDDGQILLADEISPDTCRLWDKDTNQKLDKDIFRRDLGDLTEGYKEVLNRMRG